MTSIAAPPAPLQTVIPSYLYQEYQDDENLQAFVAAYNSLAQGYLMWFNSTPLALYTSPNVAGPLLDWIGNGIYGIPRPVFSTLSRMFRAGINANPIGTFAINRGRLIQSGTAMLASDDYYRRVMTWCLYLGNGKMFSTTLLRLKVARFIYGVDGTDITLSQAQSIHIETQQIAAPVAPTLTSVAAGSLSSRTYGARVTYTNSIGETLPGPPAALTVTANYVLQVASPPARPGATGWYPYVNVLATNPGKFKGAIDTLAVNYTPLGGTNKRGVLPPTRQVTTPIAIGTPWTESTSGLVAGAALPTANTSNTVGNIIIVVPTAAGQAAKYFQQAFNQQLLSFPFQLTGEVVIA